MLSKMKEPAEEKKEHLHSRMVQYKIAILIYNK